MLRTRVSGRYLRLFTAAPPPYRVISLISHFRNGTIFSLSFLSPDLQRVAWRVQEFDGNVLEMCNGKVEFLELFN